jgi:hypothetical protein
MKMGEDYFAIARNDNKNAPTFFIYCGGVNTRENLGAKRCGNLESRLILFSLQPPKKGSCFIKIKRLQLVYFFFFPPLDEVFLPLLSAVSAHSSLGTPHVGGACSLFLLSFLSAREITS